VERVLTEETEEPLPSVLSYPHSEVEVVRLGRLQQTREAEEEESALREQVKARHLLRVETNQTQTHWVGVLREQAQLPTRPEKKLSTAAAPVVAPRVLVEPLD
jgi:hypothetical protein